MRKYYLKSDEIKVNVSKLIGFVIEEAWIQLDKSDIVSKLKGEYVDGEVFVQINNNLYEYDSNSNSITPAEINIDSSLVSDSIVGLDIICKSLAQRYKHIADKAIVVVFNQDYPANPPSLNIWDAKNLTIFDGNGERDYPYFDSDVEEVFKDEKPSWYFDILKLLED